MSQFLADPKDIDTAKGTARLRGAEAHHLSSVTRAKKGDEVRIFDGEGRRFLGIVAGLSGGEVLLENLAPLPSGEPRREIVIAQALIKGERWEWFCEKAVELGASAIIPLVTSRTVARPKEEASGRKTERWEKLLLSASKQCERGRIPGISPPVTLEAFLLSLGPAGSREERFFCAERSGAKFLCPREESDKCLLALGPEGGWSDEEQSALAKAGFAPVSLGERILRSETAAINALAVCMASEHKNA
jgi:16S rRNA (uracil1498-N3)-methyltransferase